MARWPHNGSKTSSAASTVRAARSPGSSSATTMSSAHRHLPARTRPRPARRHTGSADGAGAGLRRCLAPEVLTHPVHPDLMPATLWAATCCAKARAAIGSCSSSPARSSRLILADESIVPRRRRSRRCSRRCRRTASPSARSPTCSSSRSVCWQRESDRTRGYLSAARSSARPFLLQADDGFPDVDALHDIIDRTTQLTSRARHACSTRRDPRDARQRRAAFRSRGRCRTTRSG